MEENVDSPISPVVSEADSTENNTISNEQQIKNVGNVAEEGMNFIFYLEENVDSPVISESDSTEKNSNEEQIENVENVVEEGMKFLFYLYNNLLIRS